MWLIWCSTNTVLIITFTKTVIPKFVFKSITSKFQGKNSCEDYKSWSWDQQSVLRIWSKIMEGLKEITKVQNQSITVEMIWKSMFIRIVYFRRIYKFYMLELMTSIDLKLNDKLLMQALFLHILVETPQILDLILSISTVPTLCLNFEKHLNDYRMASTIPKNGKDKTLCIACDNEHSTIKVMWH